MQKLKVMTLVGTRPELIKLSRVIVQLDAHVSHVLVHSGQNYDFELNQVFFDDLEIRKPDYFLNAAGDTACQTIANVLIETEKVIMHEKPDAFLIYGDTNSCLGAIAAKRHKVPVFHMEAGNRCFDERVPEELNRRILDHISDINMPLTEHGRDYLAREGVRPEMVIKTGSCMAEVLEYFGDKINASDVLDRFGLDRGGYVVLSAHREENVDDEDHLHRMVSSIRAIIKTFDKDVIFSVHPRTRKRLEDFGIALDDESRLHLMKPLGFLDYVHLQQHAFCVISDSGTIAEESALLGFPAVTIRQAHERPEGMDAGVLILSGLDPDGVNQAVSAVTAQDVSPSLVNDYACAGPVSRKVLNLILSYTHYINRTVWSKH